MVRDLFVNFFKIKRRYPEYDKEHSPTSVNMLVQHCRDPTDMHGRLKVTKVSLSDWADVTLGKNAEFDYADSQLKFIKDKALGLQRSEVLKRFALPIDAQHRTKPQNRRALLKFLLTPYFSEEFQEYLGRYMNGDGFDEVVMDYLVIKLTAKELELKEQGRFFGASPMQERVRRQVQEKNVMEMMDRYVPEQLLTCGELEGMHKLTTFRKMAVSHPECTLLHVSADFSAWNNNFRRETVDETAGKVLDAWFGLKSFFKKTMNAFQHTLVYYDDRSYRVYWEDQLGGIEGKYLSLLSLLRLTLYTHLGLNQATWTFMFLAGLKESLEKLGYQYHITVKGDDVRMSLLIPTVEFRQLGFSELRRTILDEMRDKCDKLGWQLNPNESFVSMSIICTSKQYIVQDAWLPCAAKKIMKAGAVTNVIFPSLTDYVATSYSVAHSACFQSTVGLACYLTASYTANRLLVREMFTKRLSKEQFVALSLWPQILGGPGSLPLQTFFVRGENDMLSCSISLFRMLDLIILESYEEPGLCIESLRSCVRNILNQELEKELNYQQLLLDPYSLCIAHPTRPTTILKKSIKEGLQKHCEHPDVIELLNSDANEFDKGLCDALMEMEPCCPKVVSAAWECSPSYLASELVSKFLQSSTVVYYLMITRSSKKFLLRRGQKPLVLHEMIVAQDTLQNYWIKVLQAESPYFVHLFGKMYPEWTNPDVCSTRITQMVREQVWQRPIHGVTYPSLVDQLRVWDPSDMSMAYMADATSAGHIGKISLRWRTASPQVYSDSDHYKSDPSCRASLGSKTDSRVSFPDWPEELSTEPAARLLKLLIILTAASNIDANVRHLFNQLFRLLTRTKPEALEVLCPTDKQQDFHHRIPTHHYSTVTMPNYRPNLGNLISIDMRPMNILQQSSIKRTVNYAALRFMLIPLCLWPLQSRTNMPDDYPDYLEFCLDYDSASMNAGKYHLCTSCCAPIEELPLKLSRKYSKVIIICTIS